MEDWARLSLSFKMASDIYRHYFAFGSNLKKERQRCVQSTFLCIGQLKDHRLAFIEKGHGIWNGAVATVLPSPGDCVWGAVWKVTQEDVEALHKQENVAEGIYKPIGVDIHTSDSTVHCLTYVRLPLDGIEALPSLAYMKVIISGARELDLPQEYVSKLESIRHNGKKAASEDLNRIADM